MTHRPPYRAVLFYFDREVTTGSEVRSEVPATNAFNTQPLWTPSTALILEHQDMDFNADRLWGWARDKQNTGPSPHDNIQRNAPNPTHPIWRGIYTAMDRQFGVESWWDYEETLERKGDVYTQEEIENELIFRLDKTEQEIRDETTPIPTNMTELSPP